MATLIEQLKIRMERLENADGLITLDFETVAGILKEIEAIQQSSNKAANPPLAIVMFKRFLKNVIVSYGVVSITT